MTESSRRSETLKEGGERQVPHTESIGQWVGDVAHDLNNSLAAAQMHLGWLQQQPQLPDDVKGVLKELQGEMTRASTLTRQLSLLSHQPTGRSEPEPRASAEVTSQVGQGDTCRLQVPPPDEPEPGTRQSPRAEPLSGGTETILLVEDDISLQRSTALCLRKLGYAVLEAANGTDALKIWEQHRERIALVLTDQVMPEAVAGNELARRLSKERPGVKVILSSGHSEHSPMAEKGFAFLPKPYRPGQLARLVRQCLDERPGEGAQGSRIP